MSIRPLSPDDARVARSLVEAAVAGTPYGELPHLALDRVLRGNSDESLALAAVEGDVVAGVALYGLVAGTRTAAKLHFISAAGAAPLLDAVVADLRRRGARLIVAEVPDEPAVRAWRAMLEEGGFVLEGRVADYYRDGVDLLLMRRDL